LAEYPALDLRFQPGQDARLYAVLDDFQPIAIQEHETADGWLVFFGSPQTRDAAAAALSGFRDDVLRSIAAVSVPDEDWARRSQANLTAVTVGRITVAPPWDSLVDATGSRSADPGSHTADPGSGTPDPVKDRILIVIDPSMGFGTGHHQTTRLCLSLLQSAEVTGRSVIDVGTGSGVLAIAAWRLGARSVAAMDNDPDAIQNARENIERNGAAIEVSRADLHDFSTAPADIITANLTGAVLKDHASRLRLLVTRGGSLIVSGFSPEEMPDVIGAFGGGVAARAVEDEWAAAVIRVTRSGTDRVDRKVDRGPY
jgi:ribosomal protein L11 methyltransferase